MNTTLMESNVRANAAAEAGEQYSLGKILGIWASVAMPMGLILWVLMPILIPRVDVHPGFLFLNLITLGLIWQGVVAYIILRREVKPFTWKNIKERLWLFAPTHPKTGVPSNRAYLWTIPLIVLSQAYYQFGAFGWLDELWVNRFPFLAPPPYALLQNLAEQPWDSGGYWLSLRSCLCSTTCWERN